MNRRYRSGTLERDFSILFGEKAQWTWPFFDDDIVGTIISLGITTFMASIFIGIFFDLHLHREGFVGLGAAILVFETLRTNWEFIVQANARRSLRRKYLPMIQHTEAFDLLEEAVASRRRGEVDGLGNKEETEAGLIRLWKASFAEADRLAVATGTDVVVDPIDNQPIGGQINRYFDERSASYQEISQ